MCGIFGYVGESEAAAILIEGLGYLEYRGYDSAGLALLLPSGEVEVTRTTHRVADLKEKVERLNGHASASHAGIGHTRWATHGRPSETNAHPHRSMDGKIAVVHNGIFENFTTIRAELRKFGHVPRSDTDTECFPMLVSHLMESGRDYEAAFRTAVRTVTGKYAIACVHADHPRKIMLARSGPPLVVGIGEHEYFVASDAGPLLSHTRNVVYLQDGDVGELTDEGLRVFDREGAEVRRGTQRIEWDQAASELGRFRHYMHKEIFEQPAAIRRTVDACLDASGTAPALHLPDALLKGADGITMLACGTSWHAALVGEFAIEQMARVPVEVDYASEFRCRDPIVGKSTLAVAITQSGETADTIAALEEARARGAKTLAICNSAGSQMTRLADGVLLTRAGSEMGVASTKTFTTQLAVLILLAAELGRMRGTLSATACAALIAGLRALPDEVERVLSLERDLQALAFEWKDTHGALYLGRGPLYPVALEGALKLKEVSYVHAQGYPAGEMKHGPIALLDEHLPVIACVPDDAHRERTLSNLQEAAARGAPIIAFVNEGEHALDSLARSIVRMPSVAPALAPILYTIPLQLFAYHVAVLRGCDVDRPRNLAKSVTVE